MKLKVKLVINAFVILLLFSCQKREWTNPFDPDCPKTVFTPFDFRAVQVGNTIKLSWSQPEKNISGFKLTRKIDSGTTSELPDQTKDAAQYIDASLTGGKVHTYTIIAYAGSYQSNVVTVQVTPILAASITTFEISVFDYNAALVGGNITADGGSPITQRGVCYGTSQNPTTSNSFISNGSGVGNFSNVLTGLIPNTTYYARSYAINSQGTSYGQQVSFKTAVAPAASGTITDLDGNTYNTITIGTQVWMAENLKTTKFNDGTSISNVVSNTSWIAQTNPAYCWYNNDISAYKNRYGALYNWYAVNTGKLAPTGFHVATPYEWSILANYLGGINVAGAKIKLKFGWDQNLGTNASGFSLLPGGFRASDNGSFQHEGYAYNYWLISEDLNANSVLTAYILMDWVGMGIPTPSPVDAGVKNGKSVRCIKDVAPSLTTNSISSVSLSTAVCGGVINCSGGQPITSRGVCWNTSPNPTIANSKTTDGTGFGNFSSNLTGLVPGTTYYVRAYATNSVGTSYGNEVSFKTTGTISLASLTTTDPTDVTDKSAILGGNITSDGNAVVTERGICYSTTSNPTTANTKVVIGSGTGSFSSTISGLVINVTYYARAYAINSQGISYGNQVNFTTGGPGGVPGFGTVTDIDGNVYTTVKIGTQEWMAENLKTTKYNDGTPIVNVTDNTTWGTLTTGAYCWYNNDAATYKNTYGALYNWYAVNTGILAPLGWHVPNDADWNTLRTFLVDNNLIGGKLKESGTARWLSPNTGATNSVGFKALPGGTRSRTDSSFILIGQYCYLWSSSSFSSTRGWYQFLVYNSSDMIRMVSDDGREAKSVRCVKD